MDSCVRACCVGAAGPGHLSLCVSFPFTHSQTLAAHSLSARHWAGSADPAGRGADTRLCPTGPLPGGGTVNDEMNKSVSRCYCSSEEQEAGTGTE